jgi:hypothetical protein
MPSFETIDLNGEVITPEFKIVFEYALTDLLYHTDTTQRVVPVNDPVIDTRNLIQIRAEVVSAAGELVTSLFEGEEATLQIHADDLRDDAKGVFAAYFDVLFDPAQVAEIGPLYHGTKFGHGPSGAIDENGLIDETGGFNNEADLSRTLVVSIPIVAASPGELRFILEAADESPAHVTLLLGLDSPVPRDRIRLGEVVVEFVESLHNAADPMDTNMDGEMTPLDALVVINHLNRYGAGPVNVDAVRTLRAVAAEVHAAHFALDVNRDRFISPIDMLLIVNALDAHSEALAEGEVVTTRATSANSTSIAPVFVTAASLSRATSTSPSTERANMVQSNDLEDLFSSTDAFDFVARTPTHRATPSESPSNEDTFFAELESGALEDWWRGE